MAAPYDVLVAGGGVAGCAAALSAAREGATVVLVEAHTYLGGNATRALVGPWQSYHAAHANADGSLPPQVIGGIAQEFVDDLLAREATTGHVPDPIGFAGSITPVDADAFKHYLPGKLAAAGVEVRLGRALTDSNLALAPQIIDATGNGAAARKLGARVITPTRPQPMSWLFTMRSVDTAAVRDCQLNRPDQFVLHPAFEQLRPDIIAVSGFFDLVAEARSRGELTLPRDRLLFFSTGRPGEVLVNTTRIAADHANPRFEGLRQIHELAEWMPVNVPGFADAQPGRIADDIGRRETARLVGKAILTAENVTSGARHEDAVARGCYPIDIHRPDNAAISSKTIEGPGWYDIPLGCLESADVPHLLCAGRMISADPEGFASARVLPTVMATGQAAGYIATRRAFGKKVDKSACLSNISLV